MMGNEVVDTFVIGFVPYDVVGCFDGDTKENEFDFFDVFETTSGMCLTLGCPFFTKPSRAEVEELVHETAKLWVHNREESVKL
jgi:hypothetical protein